MKLLLTAGTKYGQSAWVPKNNDSQINFCDSIMSQLGLLSKFNYIMTIRFKNPRQKHFIKVELRRRNYYWTWSIPSKPLQLDFGSNYFSFNDTNILVKQFPNHSAHSDMVSLVWIKLEIQKSN